MKCQNVFSGGGGWGGGRGERKALRSRQIVHIVPVWLITKTCLYNFDPLKPHFYIVKKVREKPRQPFPDTKRKPTNPNKHKSNKRTKSTKISSLFPKRGNRNTKRTEKHKTKMTHSKTYNKSPRRINHKATKSKTNTGTHRQILGFTGIYIIFLISAQKHRLWVLVRTASPRRF